MDEAARGAAALAQGNAEEAIKHYTAAITANNTAVTYYIKRSTAYQRASDHSAALSDAEIAVVLAHKRAKRELIKDAQLRRAIALYHLHRYADAEFAFSIVKRLDEKEKTLPIWVAKVTKQLQGLPEHDERRKLKIKEMPEVELPTASSSQAASKSDSKEVATAPKPMVPTPANKIKQEWYQSSENVCFSLLAKGVPKDKATVDIQKDTLTISFPILNTSDYDLSLDPLFAPVDPAQSTYKITPTKIEVVLKKATPGVKWPSLEGDRKVPVETEDKPSVPRDVLTKNLKPWEKPPSYPTSSRKGAKDWDKVAEELTAKKKKGEAGNDDDTLDVDAEDGDETTRFFRQLYKGADPDQQRAMMKSFSESGGTVLSTDWSNVGSKTVVPEPPDGMEAKKY
jgi:suppressor of G2 allele of SKP1